jgi:hypothetical protein
MYTLKKINNKFFQSKEAIEINCVLCFFLFRNIVTRMLMQKDKNYHRIRNGYMSGKKL